MARPARCLRCDDILDELTPDGSRVCWVCVIEWQAAEARMISDLGLRACCSTPRRGHPISIPILGRSTAQHEIMAVPTEEEMMKRKVAAILAVAAGGGVANIWDWGDRH